ncbi:hypothetical protein EGW08_010698, partial [Elysia chlorotica]
QRIWKDVQFGPGGEAFVLEKRRTKGVFTEPMELQEFPFDIQVDNTSNYSIVRVLCFNTIENKKFSTFTTKVTEDEYERNKYKKPGLFFRCCVIRRAGFFIWNIMLIMSIISALSFVTFAVPRELPQNRIQLSFILLLAGVTFKFAASQSVPKISYLTHLDRYILGSMIFLFLVAGWHGMITLFEDEDDAAMDLIAFICFICLYIILHVAFVITMVVRGFSRRADVRKREREYLTRYEETHKNDSLVLTKRRLFGTRQRTRVGIRA